jgi:Uncharacterized membrane protein, possible Na+ channel or pump
LCCASTGLFIQEHNMWGTLVNAAAIIAGGALGTFLNRNLPERYQSIVFQAMGLFVAVLGISMAIKMQQMLLCVLALLLGGLLGECLRLDRQSERLGDWLKTKLRMKNEQFSEGFVNTSLLYCIGAMAILGAIEEGSGLFPTLYLTKSVMDGFSAIAFGAAMGIGVAFSAGPVILYQGGLTGLVMLFGGLLDPVMIQEISALGGLMLIGIGLDLLKITHVRVVNLLPSLVVIIPLLIWFA